MKKITLMLLVMLAFCWQSNAQVLTEGFDTGAIPAGWTTEYVSATVDWQFGATNQNGTVAPRTGAGMAAFWSNNYAGDNTRLVTPTMDLSAVPSQALNFYYTQEDWSTDQDELRIYYKTSAAGAWVLLVEYTADTDTNWTEASVVLPNPSADYYIAFDGLSGYGRGITVDDVIIDDAPTCTAPAATMMLGTVDCGASTFEIEVDVTVLGDGTPALYDGTNTTPVAATGIVTLGPYTTGTPVNITLQHGTDTDCDVNLGSIQDTCPPAEDNCMGAINIPVATDMCSGVTTGNNTNATDSDTDAPAPPAATCSSYNGGDIWFSVTVPASGNVNISGDISNCCSFLWYEVYEGADCSNLASIACSATGGNDPSAFEMELTGRTGGETLWVRAWDSNNDDGPGDFNFCAYEPTCTAPTVTIPADPIDNVNCPTTVDVSISIDDMGDSGTLTISAVDDMGDPAGTGGTVTATGVFTITNVPVPQTDWTITIAHESNTTCNVELGPFVLDCPPVNDDIANAVAITVDEGFCDGTNTNGRNTYASDSGEGAGTCFNAGSADDDVWYTFTVPSGTATVDVSTDFTGGTLTDSEIAVYSGTSGGLVELDCDQDSGTTILSNGSSWNSLITDLAVTVGETYYVQVAGYSTNTGTFCLDVSTNQVLSTNDVDNPAAFTFYPNPVQNTLTLNAQNTIEQVVMYNMLGQEVLRATPNAIDSELDMSNLQTGTYFVKVTIADVTKTVRVIKQ